MNINAFTPEDEKYIAALGRIFDQLFNIYNQEPTKENKQKCAEHIKLTINTLEDIRFKYKNNLLLASFLDETIEMMQEINERLDKMERALEKNKSYAVGN